MRLQGAGAPGTVDATVDVTFAEVEPGVTQVSYEADAVVGGMVGGVGQRMLGSVSKRMAGEFFGNVGNAHRWWRPPRCSGRRRSGVVGSPPPLRARSSPPPPAPAASPPRTTSSRASPLGAGLVLAGVVVGGLFGRRRA